MTRTPSLALFKRLSLISVCAGALIGCSDADLSNFKNQLNSTLAGTPLQSGPHGLDTVGLRNILPAFNDSVPLSEQFPHVAVYVLRSPPNWASGYNMSRVNNGCFELQAVVWTSPTASHKTEPFSYCPDVDADFSLGPAYLYSLQTPISEVASGYLTGNQRTEGPNPPSTLFPTDNHTQELIGKSSFQGGVFDLNDDMTSKIAVMFANVRSQMGVNMSMSVKSDFRVWIVSIADDVE